MTDRTFYLTVLGTPRLETREGPPVGLPSGKPLAMITFLSCAVHRSATREQLIDLLWADTERDAARHTLRQTLWYIRHKLGTTVFETQGDTVTLLLPLSVDREAFLEAFAREAHEEAVALYAGEFFPGFAASGGAQFEQWADIERRRLCSLYVHAAEATVRQRLVAMPPRESVALARGARELAPHLQSSWRRLLETLLAADDLLSASVEAEELERWLLRDDLAPEPATSAMLRLVRSTTRSGDGHPPASGASLVANLVGRDAEFLRLLTGWEEAKAGRASHLHVAARAGYGKSRLLDGLMRRLKASRARVVPVRALQANRDLPFALAADLALSLAKVRGAAGVSPDSASALVALAPGVSTYLSAPPDRATGDDALRRRTLALLELVHTIAEDAPLALLVDDVHWADPASRTMLASLSGGLGESRVLLVTAGRHGNVHAGEHVQPLSLDALSADDVRLLLESLARLPSPSDGPSWCSGLPERLHAATDGSPLLVLETLQLAIERGALARTDGAWHCVDPTALDDTLDGGSAIRQRLLDVPEAQQSTLTLLSVRGTALTEDGVRRVLGEDGVAALPLLEVRGLIAQHAAGWMVSHDEMATLTQELRTPAQLARAHRQCAQLIEADDASGPTTLVRAAQHRRAAGDTREVQQLFARLVRASAADGDKRAITALAGNVLGADAPRGERDALVQSLPWRVRANVPRVLLGAAGGAAALLMVALQLPGRSPTVRAGDVSLMTLAMVNGETVLLGAELDERVFVRDGEVTLERLPAHPDAIRTLSKLSAIYDRWNDTVVGGTLNYPEFGVELMQVDLRTGKSRRLTTSRTDDVDFRRSPDGTQAVFMSARADTITERANVYLLDLATDSIRQLTNTSDFNGNPRWSPDGSRIAFFRRYAERRRNALCVIALEEERERCLALPDSLELTALLAWDSERSVIGIAEPFTENSVWAVRVEVADGSVRVLRAVTERVYVDPGGEFGLMMRAQVGERAPLGSVVDLTNPSFDVPIRAREPGTSQALRLTSLMRRTPSPRWHGRLRVASAPASVSQDAVVRLQSYAEDTQGRRVAAPSARWVSLDSTVALIGQISGDVSPQQPGTARFVRVASGWLSDTVVLRVGPPRFAGETLTEAWEALDTSRWLPWGNPPVRVVWTENGTGALLLNGDKHLASGVYQRAALPAKSGVGVEARIRAPVSSAQWQYFAISLVAITTDSELAAWGVSSAESERERPLSWRDLSFVNACSLAAPKAESGAWLDAITFNVGGSLEAIKRLPVTLTDGQWHTVRLQVFADGRCGLAVDGQVMTVSEHTLPLDRPLRLRLQGSSVGAQMLVGPLTIWQGERSDVPWFTGAIATPASTTAAPASR